MKKVFLFFLVVASVGNTLFSRKKRGDWSPTEAIFSKPTEASRGVDWRPKNIREKFTLLNALFHSG